MASGMRFVTRKICVSTAMRGFAESHVDHDARGLAPDARQGLQDLDGVRHLAAELLDQPPRQRDDVLRLGVEEVQRPDVLAHPLLAERRASCCGVSAMAKQAPRRLVDADIGRLRREHHGDEQRVGIGVLELALGLRFGRWKRRKISTTVARSTGFGVAARAPPGPRLFAGTAGFDLRGALWRAALALEVRRGDGFRSGIERVILARMTSGKATLDSSTGSSSRFSRP